MPTAHSTPSKPFTLRDSLQKVPMWADDYVCPRCHSGLLFTGKTYHCRVCLAVYAVHMTSAKTIQPDFRPDHLAPGFAGGGMSSAHATASEEHDPDSWRTRVRRYLRQNPALYQLAKKTISPVLLVGPSSQSFVDNLTWNAKVLSVGAGVLRLKGNVTHLDYEPYPTLEVVGDAHHLPFADNTFDGVVCESMLEHVPEPERVIAEMRRVLKPGGKVFVLIPFIYGFHAAPNDFNRLTHRGLQSRMVGFEQESLQVASGPTSALNCILSEWLALAVSCGNRRAYQLLSLVFMALLSPLKLLDFLFILHPEAVRIASIFLYIGHKKAPPGEAA